MAERIVSAQQFGSPAKALAHYGVKGMQWGVRKQDPSTNERAKAYIAAAPKPSRPSEKMADDIADQQVATAQKSGFRITRKQALIGVGAAFAVGGAYYAIKNDVPQAAMNKLRRGYPKEGTKVDADTFSDLRQKSQMQARMHGGYITPKSYLQGEYTLPAGHVFHRVSGSVENDFRKNTFALHSKEDLDRYVSEFSKDGFGTLHHVTFTAKSAIRIPSLTQRLDVLKETMQSSGRTASEPEVLREYETLMKSYWTDPRASTYFKKLRDLGYHAIVDDADAGIAGESPLLLLDNTRFSQKQSRPLSAKDIDDAKANLTEIRNRK